MGAACQVSEGHKRVFWELHLGLGELSRGLASRMLGAYKTAGDSFFPARREKFLQQPDEPDWPIIETVNP